MSKNPNHPRTRSPLAAAVALFLFAGVGATPALAAEENGGTLIVAMDAEADFLDNQAAGGWITWKVNRNMFDTLVMEDLTAEGVDQPPIIPGLAESWEISDDGLTYTFHLREGVKFHDGTELDAEAVRWNIERMWNPEAEQYSAKAAACTAFSWQALESLEVVDESTIRFHLNRPFGEFIGKMVDGGCGNTSLMSPTNWEKWGNEEIGEHPVGTGPFRFVERVRGEKIVLERFDDYWGDQLDDPRYTGPRIERLIFRPMTDPATRVAALQAGEVDLIWSPPPDWLDAMERRGFQVEQAASPHVIYFALNLREPCLDDPKYRQAISHAIDRQGIAENLLKGAAVPAYGMIVPGSPSFDADFRKNAYDPIRAQELLAASSCPDGGPTMTWLIPTGGSGNMAPIAISEWIQRNLNEVGFNVELEAYEWQTYLSFWWKGLQQGQSASWMSWGMTTPLWVEVVGHSKWHPPEGTNVGWYQSEEVDALLDGALVEIDDAERESLYAEANRVMMEDAALLPIVHGKTPVLLGPNVEGYVAAPQNWRDYRTIELR
mgnify:FL=1